MKNEERDAEYEVVYNGKADIPAPQPVTPPISKREISTYRRHANFPYKTPVRDNARKWLRARGMRW